jgi:hypothetical protein
MEELDGPAVGALQRVSRAIVEAKQRSQRSVLGWVAKIYYLKLLRASEGTSLAPTNDYKCTVSRRVDVRQVAGRKNN